MISFDEYQENGGTNFEEIFNALEPKAVMVVESYINSKCPFWKVKPIGEYDFDLSEVITLEIDYLEAHGGEDAVNGNSDLNLSSVQTSGFSYSMNNDSTIFEGVPLSGIAKSKLDFILLKNGMRCCAVW